MGESENVIVLICGIVSVFIQFGTHLSGKKSCQ